MTWRVEEVKDSVCVGLLSFQRKSDAEKYVNDLKRECERTENYLEINMYEID